MGTQKSDNHEWDKPVFPSSDLDVELDSLFDQIDTDVILKGVESDRPSAGTFGRVYLTTDTKVCFFDNGTSWDDISPSPDWSISDSGGNVLSKPTDIDFGTALSVTDDGDGTVTVDVNGITESQLAFDATTVDQLFHAEGTGTNINSSNNVSWNTTILNDSAYSFDGTNVTIQTNGWYEIEADIDYYSNNTRVNANIMVQVNGSTVGVMGQSGYVRNNNGHNEASVHTRAVQQLSSGDTIRIRGRREASSDNVNPDGAQFTIKKLHR